MLDRVKQSQDLTDLHEPLAKWRHTPHLELDPVTVTVVLWPTKRAAAARAGLAQAAAVVDQVRAVWCD